MTDLQKPEAKILSLVRDELSQYGMLDIGVGGGRTSRHFAPIAKRYVGIDYSRSMIESCRRLYNLDFTLCDVRELSFPDSEFDFVLFSYNGIDYLDVQGRERAFYEMRRVLQKGGKLMFSSHNLNYAPELFAIRPTVHPRGLLNMIKKRTVNHLILRKIRFGASAILNDGVLNFKLLTYYVRPAEQIRQLETHRFGHVRVFGLTGGEILVHNINLAKDPWLYYFCEAT